METELQSWFTVLLLLFSLWFSRHQIKADREEERNNQKKRAALGFLSKAGRENTSEVSIR